MVKIGILTYFASINYGAFLQAYSLQECLKSKFGNLAKVEMVNYESKIAHEIYLKRIIDSDPLFRDKMIIQYDKFLESRDRLQLTEKVLVTNSINQVKKFLQGKYDIIIAGSDEIWRTDSIRGFPTAYWLNFNTSGSIYMAYAVSGRNNYQQLADSMQKYIKESISRFAYVGTRDEVTKKELQKIVDQEIDRNCDPVFLMPELFRIYDKQEIKQKFRAKYSLNINKPLVSLMVEGNEEVVGKIYKMMRYDNSVINLYVSDKTAGIKNLVELSPFEWSDMIGISDLVITNFFHGTVFSLLHGVPFIALECMEKGRGKIENLLLENFMGDKFLYQSNYKGNNQKLAVDLYTKGRKEMQYYNYLLAENTVIREGEKSRNFFEILKKVIG